MSSTTEPMVCRASPPAARAQRERLSPAPTRRRPHRVAERALRALPYPLAVRAVQHGLAPCARRIVDAGEWVAFPTADGTPRRPSLSLVRRRLLTTLLGTARLVALSRSSEPRDGSHWFAVRGLAHLEAARASGRKVVVVNSHYGAAQCVPLLIARLGLRLHSVECCDPFAALGLARPPGLTVIPTASTFLAQTAVRAKRALDDEALICIAADGFVGASGLTLPFHGRVRRFAAGFAELATAADAAVVPVLAPIDDRGRVTLQFGAAFADVDAIQPRAARVAALIRRYAAWLEQRWAEDPGNVFNMHQFAALPLWPAASASRDQG